MNLPELPKQHKQREASSSIDFRDFIEKHPMAESCTFEMKDTRGKDYLNFNEVKDKQIAYGLSVNSNKGTLIRVQGLRGEPDYSYFINAPSYIVIHYPCGFFMIETKVFVEEKNRSNSKSLNSTRAKEICFTCSIEQK